MFTPVTYGRISADIVEQVKAALRDGRLAPGDQLPAERDLTRQLGVSRVSVRDALRMLEAHGLIEVRVGARGGAFVTAPAPELVGEGIANMLLLAALAPKDVTEARLVLEIGMLELVCERADETDLAALDEICDRTDAVVAAGRYEPELSAEFHTRLAEASHNDAISMLAHTFHGPLLVSLRKAKEADPEAGRAGAVEHRALLDAVRAKDTKTARRVMRAHLQRTARRVAAA